MEERDEISQDLEMGYLTLTRVRYQLQEMSDDSVGMWSMPLVRPDCKYCGLEYDLYCMWRVHCTALSTVCTTVLGSRVDRSFLKINIIELSLNDLG